MSSSQIASGGPSRALNDDQADQEMKKLIEFIRHEALEKSQEIKLKADEDFNIEKAKIVREDSVKLEQNFEKQVKQNEVKKRIVESKMNNASRLAVLKRQQELVDQVFEQVEAQLKKKVEDSKVYAKLVQTLCVEGLEKLGLSQIDETQPSVTVRVLVRNHLVEVARKSVKAAEDEFKAKHKKDGLVASKVKLDFDTSEYLSDNSIGGVHLSISNGSISVTNTIESRIQLCTEKALPMVRLSLFGPSPNRKFYN
ncbi:V-ATPase V1 sector subunit E [Mycoemilia scoparia]|uniref:V-ATPase V1 sector subunit E n=1 Tax=Mycoemilia scoparia TaxID=417184 RepID=A0A9W8DQH1_9FUNG|nr:V-ATPase V1 sector subunit E [Mycoemilia scoparia]